MANELKSEQVANGLREQIVNNFLKGHERIVEEDISKKFGVSRISVRDALRQLEREGFISRIPNIGTFVKEIGIKDIQEIYDIRKVLEGLAVELITPRITDEQIDKLVVLQKQDREAHKKMDADNMITKDLQFHKFIIDNCGNSRIKNITDIYYIQLKSFMIYTLIPVSYLKIPQPTTHEKILEAIKIKNSKKASELMVKHIGEAKEAILKFLVSG